MAASVAAVSGGPSPAQMASEAEHKIQFLLTMSTRFEEEGNIVEAVKSTETALLLRKHVERTVPATAGATSGAPSLLKQVQDLVVKCNSVAVEEFQNNRYDTASFLLNKALFLTDDLEETNLFGDAEHDRLRLRAATYNNLGCLEKRRGRLHASLEHLQKAAQLEVTVDPDVGASPSTHLNLCTILNKLGNPVAAVSAAHRAVSTLKYQAQQGVDSYPNFAMMLAAAYFNLGTSLEACDRPGDIAESLEAYENCLSVADRYQLSSSNPSVVQAANALQRLRVSKAALVLPPTSSSRAGAPLVAGGGGDGSLVPAPPKGKRASGVVVGAPTPYTLGALRMQSVRGGTTPSLTPAPPSSKLTDAAMRHAERIQSRQRKKEVSAERDQMALQRAQRAHVREKEEKLKREREAEAARREEMARQLYDKMVSGLRAEEIKRIKNAAKKIQKVWRGVLARSLIAKMQDAAAVIQRSTRIWLCRIRIQRTEQERQQRAQREAQLKRQVGAAVTIQRHVRRFLRRIEIIRQYRARNMRRLHSARRIQRVFRSFCHRREQRILAQLEAEKTADEKRLRRQHDAARRIQSMFRAYKMRRITRIVALEQQRRSDAATRIQALVRGVLTRIWFQHYRLYRRQQELSSSKNLRVIIKIQAAWRRALAVRERKRRTLQKQHEARLRHLNNAARRIQCAWRCHMARATVRPLRAQRHRQEAAVRVIEGAYQTYRTRVAYVARRDAIRRDRAARLIGIWFRERVILAKHRATARYHAEIQRRQRIALLRTQAALMTQSFLQARLSSYIVESTRRTYMKQSFIAHHIQKAGRGYTSRKDTAELRQCARIVDEQRRVALRRRRAACVIQRATRVLLAKNKVTWMRIRRAASLMISKTYRMHRAKQELRRLKRIRREALEQRAVRVIQRAARKFLKKLELRRLDAYYSEKNRQKLALMRREEAAVSIQAIWRGHATRRETTAERNRLLQNTIDAIRIQRQFRAYRFRKQINAEIARRIVSKRLRRAASIKIQSFWRAVLAREYAAMLKERRFNTTVCAIAIQCAWRRFVARKELERRRQRRMAEQLLRAKHHDIWMHSVTAITSLLRSRQSGMLRLSRLKTETIRQLTEKQRETYLERYTAATKIQATYRGYYERAYARGLRMEKRDRERREAQQRAKELRAVVCMQCFWRCFKSRMTVRRIRFAKSEAQIAQQIEREAVVDPKDVVKRLFWSHEAVVRRDLSKERMERHLRMERAAVCLQRNARMWIAIRKYRTVREQRLKDDAARRILAQWREHEEEQAKRSAAARLQAAVLIQALFRGVLTRSKWMERQRRLSYRRGSAVLLEDLYDQAAIKIQSAWRMCRAKVLAHRIRSARLAEKEAQLKHESARMIQKHFRGHQVRQRLPRR